MPKVIKPAKKKPAKTTSHKATTVPKAKSRPPTVARPAKPTYSEEYGEYLERYALFGTGHPRLSSDEFDRLDDEMLDLLDLEFNAGLNDEQIIRLQELEFLLLDTEQ